jgi:hypothetical protein
MLRTAEQQAKRNANTTIDATSAETDEANKGHEQA